MSPDRTYVQTLAAQYIQAGQPTAWFEVLYTEAQAGRATVPWADLRANPYLVEWLEAHAIQGYQQTALTVGCGLGDDAEALAQQGFQVTGFDIAPSAIAECQTRFSTSSVRYVVADLLQPPVNWQQAFDFVFESYTLQALPASLRASAMQAIANFVAPQGQLLVICRGTDSPNQPPTLPDPLTQAEVLQFVDLGLQLEAWEDFWDRETPPVRRFRALFRRPAV